MRCRWSGAGHVECTVEVRKKYPRMCGMCEKNPDKLVQKIVRKGRKQEQRGLKFAE